MIENRCAQNSFKVYVLLCVQTAFSAIEAMVKRDVWVVVDEWKQTEQKQLWGWHRFVCWHGVAGVHCYWGSGGHGPVGGGGGGGGKFEL